MTTDPPRDYTGEAVDAVLAMARAERDVADWLAVVLATVAAELGSTDAVVAGRPGSWESALVLELLHGTVGPADEVLDHYRRTPTGGATDER